jgi:hypothetical protein
MHISLASLTLSLLFLFIGYLMFASMFVAKRADEQEDAFWNNYQAKNKQPGPPQDLGA